MARLRDARAYRRIKRAYVRKSKLRKKDYVKGAPYMKVAQYEVGNPHLSYSHEVQLVSQKDIQVRDNAIEAARQAAVRPLEANAAKEGYWIKVRAVPHHVLREKPLATGAGADRFQQGMSQSFGKPVGHAAQVHKGKVLFSFYVHKDHIDLAKLAAGKAKSKLPMRCAIKVFDRQTGKEVVF